MNLFQFHFQGVMMSWRRKWSRGSRAQWHFGARSVTCHAAACSTIKCSFSPDYSCYKLFTRRKTGLQHLKFLGQLAPNSIEKALVWFKCMHITNSAVHSWIYASASYPSGMHGETCTHSHVGSDSLPTTVLTANNCALRFESCLSCPIKILES